MADGLVWCKLPCILGCIGSFANAGHKVSGEEHRSSRSPEYATRVSAVEVAVSPPVQSRPVDSAET